MDLFTTYAPIIATATPKQIESDTSLAGQLTLIKDGQLQIDYAPFDDVNSGARVVLVGLTPGRQQARNALLEANRQLAAGADLSVASRKAKETGSFSGPMRSNLIAMLDHVGIPAFLGVRSTAQLFQDRTDLVHYTSAIRHPTYLNGENWNGNPRILTTAPLRDYLFRYLASEIEQLKQAVFVPLGDRVAHAIHEVMTRIGGNTDYILDGLPHPSGANAERIAYFLGNKNREALSAKTSADTIDSGKRRIQEKLGRLMRNG